MITLWVGVLVMLAALVVAFLAGAPDQTGGVQSPGGPAGNGVELILPTPGGAR